jgi:hypothetical protein
MNTLGPIIDQSLSGAAAGAVTIAAREVWKAARRINRALDDAHQARVDLRALTRQLGTHQREASWGPLEHYLRERKTHEPEAV